MENEKVINKRIREYSKGTDTSQTIIIFLLALLVPIFLGQVLNQVFGEASTIATNSQIIIGTIVNMALVMTAINLKGWAKILGVVTMLQTSMGLTQLITASLGVVLTSIIYYVEKKQRRGLYGIKVYRKRYRKERK